MFFSRGLPEVYVLVRRASVVALTVLFGNCTPSEQDGSVGGINLRSPTGGAAYRMPSHCATPSVPATPVYVLHVVFTAKVPAAVGQMSWQSVLKASHFAARFVMMAN